MLVYASDASVRDRVRTSLGVRPVPDLEIEIEEVAAGRELVARADLGGLDLLILDGEATPTGGLGLCRQLKDELDEPLPTLVILGRRDDSWLASWSRADGVVMHPIDAMQLSDAVVALLDRDAGAAAVVPGH